MENPENQLKMSKSFYEKINEMLNKSPTTVITSICALFIVIILSLTLPLYFPLNNSSTCNNKTS